jgi:hypothetical protein
LENNLWELMLDGVVWKGDWDTNTFYSLGNLVKYGGIVYKCISAHQSAATELLGLEEDIDNWEIYLQHIDYVGEWQTGTRYKRNDVVKWGGTLWIALDHHQSQNNLSDNGNDWAVWIPGLTQVGLWQSNTLYRTGDIVIYGGYSYSALTNNQSIPFNNTTDWELIATGINYSNQWNVTNSYKTGDLVLNNGYLYLALENSTGIFPDSDPNTWRLLITSTFFKKEWLTDVLYYLGDIVTFRGTTYVCVSRHISDEEKIPVDDISNSFWKILIQGSPNNVLEYPGDLKIADSNDNPARLPLGNPKELLKVNRLGVVSWEEFEIVPKVYFVSMQGTDTPTSGTSRRNAFRTIKYACDYILQDEENRAPATIKVLTGVYSEELPISVPANVALDGDELRSTSVVPAPSYEQDNMFYVRNGSGIRNMTLTGLSGTLGDLNQYLTRRPTAGAYVSLDPGSGPTDENVWIKTKSPYIQNVTTIGSGCIGLKVDGTLHNGGYDSIVANDFTQVLSDGIGIWIKGIARSELVSVFTYYCHIGYLAEDGGKIRATNGNNSYGDFGAVSEGVDQNEVPITAELNNKDNEAEVDNIITFGTTQQQIISIGYSHAGQNYTTANIDFFGSGTGAIGQYNEFRNNAISYLEIEQTVDNVLSGGFGYQFVTNNAQGGNLTTIQLAQSDIGTSFNYTGMRIVIQSGLGVGQYGYISSFDTNSKICVIRRETDNEIGWDHLKPGWPIESVLDSTTKYIIEPRVVANEPEFTVSSFDIGSTRNWKYITYGDKFVAVTEGGPFENGYVSSSVNGETNWSEVSLGSEYTISGIVWTGQKYIIARSQFQFSDTDSVLTSSNASSWSIVTLPITGAWTGIASNKNGTVVMISNTQDVVYSTDHGENWTASSIGGTDIWAAITFGNGKFVAINFNGDVASSIDGDTWTITSSAVPQKPWTEITYGNGKFVAVSTIDTGDIDSSVTYSFDGTTWYTDEVSDFDSSANEFTNIVYGEGIFLLTGQGTDIARSTDGRVWRLQDLNEVRYATTTSGNWNQAAYGLEKFVVVNNGSNIFNVIRTGATPIIRAKILTSRITGFVIYDPGSGYVLNPTITVFDPRETSPVQFTTQINNGVLAQPEMIDRGSGYFVATATISGDGFAEKKQIGDILAIKNLSLIPRVGSNIKIGNSDQIYTLVRIENLINNNPTYDARIKIFPSIDRFTAFNDEANIEIRTLYSQVRLTGHDFLDVGTGNFLQTDYPDLYKTNAELDENTTKEFNQVVQSGGGRIFYTATDQDGNFRVGELFEVRQASGAVTLSASQFDLSGLSELTLGGVRIGGSSTVIREFSTDGTFIANSDNIVPTQAAIAKYIISRITSGGSTVTTNTLISGQIRITSNVIDTTSGLQINVPVTANFKKGVSGTLLAIQYYNYGKN